METGTFGCSISQLGMEKIKSEIETSISRLTEEIASACKEHSTDKANFFFQQALLLGKIGRILEDSSSVKQEGIQTHILSSLFLHDCFRFLNKGREESMHFVTGPQVGNVSILDRIIDLPLKMQTFVFAKAEDVAVRKTLIYLSKCEHRLQGCFHIHPGMGIGSTMPSGVDLRLQGTLDRGGYKAIGAIFSRDGYIRFYSGFDFEMQIYGKGVEKIDGKIYRITEIS